MSTLTDAHIKMTTPEELAAASVSMKDVVAETGRLQSILSEYGYAVVNDVMTQEECSDLEGLWGEDLKGIVDKDESNPLMYKKISNDPVYDWPLDSAPLGGKFVSDYGLPQGRLAWGVRTNANIKRVYQSLYNGETELCCGTDNVFFNNRRAPKVNSDSERQNNLWPHIDQNIEVKPSGDWDCYQGVLYVWGVGADSSTTVVWPSSHKLVEKTSVCRGGKSHFVRLPPEMRPEFVEGARRVLVPVGSLLLWNSKTVHQGWSNGPRLAVPVCFEPKSRREEDILQAKIRVLQVGSVTTHWASLGVTHHAANLSHRKNTSESGLVLVTRAHMHLLAEDQETVLPKYLSYL